MGDITPHPDDLFPNDREGDLERLRFLRGEGLEALALYGGVEDADVRGAIFGLLRALAKPQPPAPVDTLP